MEQALLAMDNNAKKSRVKLSRSRVETRVTISLFGSLEETEPRLQKIYQGICK